MGEVLPLFPLSHVLLPGMPLPLHIFEPRYRQLLVDVADTPRTAAFGVVALRNGTETAGPHTHDADPDVAAVGTVAEIVEAEQNKDGTSDLLCVGSRRFRIERLIPDGKPYLRASVSYLPEPDGALTPLAAERARDMMSCYDTLLMRVAGRATGTDLPADAGLLSYQLAARLPLGPLDRQALLEDETTADRFTRLHQLLRRELVLLQHTRSIAVSPSVLRVTVGTN